MENNHQSFKSQNPTGGCATYNCSEYKFTHNAKSRGFIGSHGIYPANRGYKIDLSSDRTANVEIISKLKEDMWIDQDTRAVQIIWSIYSAWSETYNTFQANFEMPGNGIVYPVKFA